LLRPFVRAFAQRTVVGVVEAQPMPAYLETVIQFDFADRMVVRSHGGAWETARDRSIVGPHTFAGTQLRFDGSIDSFAIFLQPSALWALFGIPTSAVMETHFDAEAVLGVQMMLLWETLAETLDFRRRVSVCERHLLEHASFDRRPTCATSAAARLARLGGRIAISELAGELNISPRQLERSFLREIGITPKRFARVARFQSALDAGVKSPDRTWLDIAHSHGYHDHMHLVHDFSEFSGYSPTLTISGLGDSRPLALARSTTPV
jgi:AraC-like DNA-binding protein